MQFKEVAVVDAEGWTVAHSVELEDKRVPKNTIITGELQDILLAADIETVPAYRLEDGDLDENTAAHRIAHHLAGPHLRVGKPARGRCNLYADGPGLFHAASEFHEVNRVDPAIGVATLPDMAPVSHGKLVATIKIIPYGLAAERIMSVESLATKLKILPFEPFEASIISSGAALNAKAFNTTKNRIESIQGKVRETLRSAHTVQGVAAALERQSTSDVDLILLSGLSAISDHRDVLPAALEKAGGTIIHLGMPVDPGNLLMLGTIKGKTVIGMPGCAKSPSINGFDWVLERFAARQPLTPEVIQSMGIGGLLKEPVDRPEPRAPAKTASIEHTAVVLLAAGKSSRSGKTHKLLAQLDNKPVIEQTVISLKKAGFKDITVVTGARSGELEAALSGQQVSLVHNPDYETGMGSSLNVGIKSVNSDAIQCLICLADMPFVAPSTYQALVEAAGRHTESTIFAPSLKGKRGNPILWRRSMFDALSQVSGDIGGRQIMRENQHKICEVDVGDPGILIDLDTPEALKQFGIMATD